MSTDIYKEVHYGKEVWVNQVTEPIRKTECLCLRCGEIKKCNTAHSFYELCIKTNTALLVTRCPSYTGKK